MAGHNVLQRLSQAVPNLIARSQRRLRHFRLASPGAMSTAADDGRVRELEHRVAYLESVVRYLNFQVSHQSSIVRYLAAPVIQNFPSVRETKESFDFQW